MPSLYPTPYKTPPQMAEVEKNLSNLGTSRGRRTRNLFLLLTVPCKRAAQAAQIEPQAAVLS